jgi:peptidoglycan hydrolase-like protein with peptidoglycan-binding domain
MKKALIILAVLAAAAAAWIVAFPGKNPFKNLFGKSATAGTPIPVTTAQPINTGTTVNGAFQTQPVTKPDALGFPLRQGSTGTYVKAMQAALNDRFGSSLVVDGIFGPKTYKAVSANGFNADAVSYQEYQMILGKL